MVPFLINKFIKNFLVIHPKQIELDKLF